MQYMATAVNALKRPGREVLLLHHVGGRTAEDLAGLLELTPEEVRARLGRAERRLAGWLGGADVPAALARFAAGLDRHWMAEVAAGALDYLAGNADLPVGFG
ncbi:MAG: sigma-70 family RNA polymerase sigma factor [Planctomycetes bacterium]|nr:sigma-70 family RNA polymerase sigma factor [Planctomycetota bacterium]